ncbi:hypothetical protein FD724_39270 (plasmid) [Nostoc sp. C057]|uniref:hypothetical protein n=1 Tax=Nostoc sp. C057 TaxID=2576903 RepID=UPI0015C2D7C6|nr:hypothetical protein [Nostoc sp. C057]QLE53865.1 hypothetical protein FD724_39270 [Nostoc sp. C057]
MLTAANVTSEMAVELLHQELLSPRKVALEWSKVLKNWGCQGAVDDEDAFKNIIEGVTPDGSGRY